MNAVNRLSDGLDVSFGLSGEAAPPVAAEPARSMLGARAQLSADHVRGELAAGQVGQNKETQLSRLVSVLNK